MHICHAHIYNLSNLSQLPITTILSMYMPFPYATKAVKAWIIIGERRPELKHAVKLIVQSLIDG